MLAYLLATLGQNRTAVKKLLKHGAIAVNGRTTRQFDQQLAPGDEVLVTDLRAAAATAELAAADIEIVYEDDDLVVLDKPAGLLTVATEIDKIDTLFFRLSEYWKGRDGAAAAHPQVVHRLDHGTSGLVLFAKSAEVKALLQERWPTVEKTYFAVVEGTPRAEQGTVTSYLVESKSLKVYSNHRPSDGARRATTHYRLLESRGGLSLLQVRLATGRKHQIRVHLAELGTPVTGDHRYGAKQDPCERLALHAGRLTLAHPKTGEPLLLVSPLPRAMAKLFPEFRSVATPDA
ncbi:MAG: RluA family pseudouridine synthase [Planctomycetes bacterium]|nr:RluA family pseudouridine synthase [Planctomycetota bacterium]